MSAVSEQTEVDLAAIVTEHQAEVWRYLRYLGANSVDADDLTQETFVALSRSSFCYQSRLETAAYLRTVARNQLLMLRRLEGREVDTVQLTAAEEAWADAVGPGSMDDFLVALADCLTTLEGRAQSVIDMFYRDGLGRAEIATALDMQPDGVKTLLRRTRQLLRKCIERKTKEPQKG